MAKKSTTTKGKRYTPEEKQAIIDFVNEANKETGRGGASAAVKKFGVSALTISSWIKAAGTTKVKASKGTAGAGKGARPQLLLTLTSLDREIGSRRKELEVLEAKFQKLKAQL